MSTTATGVGSVQLCASCQLLDWPQLPIADGLGPIYQLDPPYKTFGLLEESAAAGCTFCQSLWCCIINSEEVAEKQVTQLPLNASLWMDVFLVNGRFDLTVGAKWTSMNCNSRIDFEPLQAEERDRTEILELQKVKQFSPGTILNDLEELVKDTILPWMKDCYENRENHSHCGLSGHGTVFPTRLIDVGEAEDDLIRLVETDHDSVTNPYLILSYCWGHGNQSARTTRDNLESRLCRFSTTMLPKTIRDAILLTRMMGFQYLWVDAMCIVQASNDDPGDFKLEAMRMRDYYANAQCCISASLARDSSEGFLTGRPLGRFPVPRAVTLKLSSSTSSQSALFEGKGPDYHLAKVLQATPLMERGWYVQELMLSRRILHWTLHGVYLECQSSFFIEGRAQRVRRGPPEDIQPREVLAVPDDDVLTYAGWYQLINTYSHKQLSYESDRMYAIHGIASLLVQRCGAEYLCGVFRSSIAQGLAWCHDWEGVDDPETPERRPPKHVHIQLPTWSWASNCAVWFRPIEDPGFVRDDHPQRPPLFPVHPKNMSLTEGIDNRLYVRAPLINVFLQRVNDQITASIEDRWGERRSGLVIGGLDAQRSNQRDTLYDSFLAGLDEGISILWLVLGLDANDNDWYIGLLLQRKGETLYQRYGLLQILWEPDDVEDRFNTVEEIILE